MASNLSDGFAIYPMVEESEATGVVAGVYAELLTRMPFVPSLFKSFALCPAYLVLAYEQSTGVLDGDALETAGQELGASVRDVVQPPEQEEVRQTLAQFVGPLGRMLLLSSGLLRALQGELEAPPAPGQAPPVRPVEPDQPAPSQWDAPSPALYGEIRAALDTPIINTIWRQWPRRASSSRRGRRWPRRSRPAALPPTTCRREPSTRRARCRGPWSPTRTRCPPSASPTQPRA
jgi:hypothetical protein